MRQALAAAGHAPDIFTFQAARELLPPELAAAIVRESRLARLPGLRQKAHDPGRWRYLLPYMHTYFGRLDLDENDVVISSSHANAAHVRTRPDALHLCYCHTPMRYAWLSETEHSRRSGLTGLGLRTVSGWLRRVDLQGSRRPDVYVAKLGGGARRIQRFYGRDAYVVHPPVDVGRFNPSGGKEEGHFLWVHRLVGYKHPELVAEAFRGLPYRLTMIGVGPLEQRLRAILPPNVQLRGWTSESDLVRLFERAIGFIHVGEEDFGISMVEALAAGTPVIGFAGGGARDIVRENLRRRSHRPPRSAATPRSRAPRRAFAMGPVDSRRVPGISRCTRSSSVSAPSSTIIFRPLVDFRDRASSRGHTCKRDVTLSTDTVARPSRDW